CTMACSDHGTAIEERRLQRLEEELRDERVRLPLDGPGGRRLLAELAYARRPLHHESRIPGYGALVFDGVPDWDACPQVPLVVPAPDVPAEVLRRYADGRSSFVVVTPDGITGLATFEHSVEDEGAAVRMQRSGAVVVQRTRRGAVRVCAGHGVVLWNGSRWMFKPRAEDYVRALRRLAPHADPAVLAGLLELAVHSLSSARVGATFVWNVDGRPPDDPRGGLLELGRAITGPPLSVARRGHFRRCCRWSPRSTWPPWWPPTARSARSACGSITPRPPAPSCRRPEAPATRRPGASRSTSERCWWLWCRSRDG